MVRVVDQDGHAIHVQAERKSEQQQHQQRNRQRHSQAAGIAQDMAALLQHHGLQPPQAHAAFLSSASIMATKTSSMEGSIGSSLRMSMPRLCSNSRRRAIAPSSATVTCRPLPNTATSATPGWPSNAFIASRMPETSRRTSVRSEEHTSE